MDAKRFHIGDPVPARYNIGDVRPGMRGLVLQIWPDAHPLDTIQFDTIPALRIMSELALDSAAASDVRTPYARAKDGWGGGLCWRG